jgi:flagellar biosynthesis protein FlhG
MIHDQADELRHLVRMRAASGVPSGMTVPLVVVAGGKGGVGATTIAVNLAVALARQGRRAVFVDADLDHGGNSRLTPHSQQGSVLDVLAGRRSVHEVLERGPLGVQVLSGAWAEGTPVEFSAAAQHRFITDLKHLGAHADIVVIDAGSSRSPFARGLWRAASVVLAVTTTDPGSIMECYAAIKVQLDAAETASVYTLANRSDEPEAAAEVQGRIAEACRRFLGMSAIAAGVVETCPPTGSAPPLVFPSGTQAARSMDQVAETLWTQTQLTAPNASRRPEAKSA